MTFQNFISRLNWRQVLLHFVAFWFFIHAFQTLSYLYDTALIDTVRNSKGQVTEQMLAESGLNAADLTYFVFWTGISGFIGLLLAFIISLTISIRRGWFWANALTTFILTYLFYRYNLLGWTFLKRIFWYFGLQFNNATVEFIFNGTVLIAIGLLIFFLRRPIQFIENKRLETV